MTHFLREYLERGLSSIVVIDEGEEEKNSGSFDQDIWETVVARKADGFVKMSYASHQTYMYNAKHWDGPTKEEAITAEEYRALASGKEIVDTDEARAQIAHGNEIRRKRDELNAKLQSLKPKCPKCKGEMTQRSGPRGSFWGCEDYPSCRGTVNLSPQVSATMKELESLMEY